MAISFPNNPQVNDSYQVNGRHYIWNGSKWRRRRPQVEATPSTLEVQQDFSAGDVFHVDSSNDSVGIGTATPNASDALTVGGHTTITGNLDVSGYITVPTQTSTTNDTKVATTAFVQTAISDLIGGAPAALDTLNELAAAINDDSSYAASITTSLAGKSDTGHTHSYLPLTGGTVTGQTTFSATDGVKLTGTSGGVWFDDRNGDGSKYVLYHSGNFFGIWDGAQTHHRFYDSGRMDVTDGGDNNYIYFGPNASWGGQLYVGATTDKAGTKTAAVISTDGNLHLDVGDSKTMYLNYYTQGRPVNIYGTTTLPGYAFHSYSLQGTSNVAGTGSAIYTPSGIYSTGTNWLYGTLYLNGNNIGATSQYGGTVYMNNWFRSSGATGMYNESYAGGWFMQDTSWVRSYNGKHIYSNGGQIRGYKSATSSTWDTGPMQGHSSGYNGYGHQCAGSNTHTGQLRPASGIWYVRNYNDGAYWTIAAYISNQSSRRFKQDIETWGTAKPLSSAVNATFDTTATDLIKQLRPVSYRLKKHERLVRHVPDDRRRKALERLNEYKIKRGLEQYDGEEAVHQCGRDCEGTVESPCVMYQNWERGTIGFIAEEVGEIIPEATDMNIKPDSPYQGENGAIDGLALTAVLTKAMQEMEARIAELESRLG